MNVKLAALRVLCDRQHDRLLRMFRAAAEGMPLQLELVMERFGISQATAKRDCAKVRRALKAAKAPA